MLRMVSRPIAVTKRLSRRPRYLASEGALRMAYIGSRHSSEAIIGAPHGLNQVEDMGLAYATTQVEPMMNTMLRY